MTSFDVRIRRALSERPPTKLEPGAAAEILRGEKKNRHELLEKFGGFATLGWLLEMHDGESLFEVFPALLELTEAVGWEILKPQRRAAGEDLRLLQQMVQHVWLNFRIWRNRETRVQEELLRLMNEALQEPLPGDVAMGSTSPNTSRAKYCLGYGLRCLQKEAVVSSSVETVGSLGLLLDACAEVYVTDDDMQRDNARNAANRVLRRQCEEVAVELLRPPQPVDPRAALSIVEYLEYSSAGNAAMQAEGLQVLLVSPLVSRRENDPDRTYPRALLESCGGLSWLLRIVRKSCPEPDRAESGTQQENLIELWSWAIKGVSSVLSSCDSPSRAAFGFVSNVENSDNASDGNDKVPLFLVLKRVLLQCVQTSASLPNSVVGGASEFVCSCFEQLYVPLLELVLGRCDTDSTKMHPFDFDPKATPSLQHAEVLSVLFELAIIATNMCLDSQDGNNNQEYSQQTFALQRKLLRDVSVLLSAGHTNRMVFAEQRWQTWLLALLATTQRACDSVSGDLLSPESASWDLVVDVASETASLCFAIFKQMHVHQLFHVDGWKAFTDTQALVAHFASRFGEANSPHSVRINLSPEEIERRMLMDIISAVQESGDAGDSLLSRASSDIRILGSLVTMCTCAGDILLFGGGSRQFTSDSSGSFDSLWFFSCDLRRDTESGAWLDFLLSSNVLALIQTLLQTCHGIRSQANPASQRSKNVEADVAVKSARVREFEMQLRRHQLYMLLTVLHEVDGRGVQVAQESQRTELQEFQLLVSRLGSTPSHRGTKEAVGRYVNSVAARHSQLDQRTVDMTRGFIDQLRALLTNLSGLDDTLPSGGKRLYDDTFLFTAAALVCVMRNSAIHSGKTGRALVDTFSSVVARSISIDRPGCKALKQKVAGGMSKDDTIEYVIQGCKGMDFAQICSANEEGRRRLVDANSGTFCLYGDILNAVTAVSDSFDTQKQKVRATASGQQSALLDILQKQEIYETQSVDAWQWESSQKSMTHSINSMKDRELIVQRSYPRILDVIAGPRGAWPRERKQDLGLQGSQDLHSFVKLSRGQDFLGRQREYVADKKQAASVASRASGPMEDALTIGSVAFAALLAEGSAESSSLASSTSSERSVNNIFECQHVRPMHSIAGKMEISSTLLVFVPFDEPGKSKTWDLLRLECIRLRRYCMSWSALEIVIGRKRKAEFFAFGSRGEARSCYDLLARSSGVLGLPSTDMSFFAHPGPEADIYVRNELGRIVRAWQQRRMSNFEYLSRLNAWAGRTRCDLAQWPVFPWVIQDYESSELHLEDPATFRDLSKPVGALSTENLASARERYEQGLEFLEVGQEDEGYLYGVHFSTPSIPLYFLVRLQPFSRHFLTLQGGKWDVKERMFTSVPGTWQNCVENMGDNKELIPEFFTTPDLFTGAVARQSIHGIDEPSALEHLGPVELPPWAHGSAEKFVQLNRAALESDYVSDHLNEWVDLVFGIKSYPRAAALDANNLFHPNSYEQEFKKRFSEAESRLLMAQKLGRTSQSTTANPVSEEAVASVEAAECELQGLKDFVQNFGQSPPVIFAKAHLQRLSPASALKLAPPARVCASGNMTALSGVKASPIWASVVGNSTVGLHLTSAFDDGTLIAARLPGRPSANFQPQVVCRGQTEVSPKSLGIPITRSTGLFCSVRSFNSRNTGTAVDDAVTVIHSDFWSYGISVMDLDISQGENGKSSMVFNAPVHGDTVTCVASDEFGRIIATSGADTTVRLWGNVEPTSFSQLHAAGKLKGQRARAASAGPLQHGQLRRLIAGDMTPLSLICTLIGHDGPVTSANVSSRAGLVVSGGEDGTVIVHTLDGVFVKSLTLPASGDIRSVSHVLVSPFGHVVAVFELARNDVCCVFEDVLVSGKCLETFETESSRITQLKLSADGGLLVAGDSKGVLRAWSLPTLAKLSVQGVNGSASHGTALAQSPISALALFEETNAENGRPSDVAFVTTEAGDWFLVTLPGVVCS